MSGSLRVYPWARSATANLDEYATSLWPGGQGRDDVRLVVVVEPLRLIHEHQEIGPMELYLRFEPEHGATHCVIDADYDMPGTVPGFIKEIMTKGWFERQTSRMLEDFKAIAEAKVPA